MNEVAIIAVLAGGQWSQYRRQAKRIVVFVILVLAPPAHSSERQPVKI